MRPSYFFIFALILFLPAGCSLFFGNVKPPEEKSSTYGIMDISKANHDWARLDPKAPQISGKGSDTTESGISDAAYQSKKTSSVISINSACRNYEGTEQEKNLQELSRELLLGISDVTVKDEKNLTLEKMPALQTTIKGKINNETVMLRTIVLKQSRCVYDLMYIARPDNFEENEPVFSQFANSLRIK